MWRLILLGAIEAWMMPSTALRLYFFGRRLMQPVSPPLYQSFVQDFIKQSLKGDHLIFFRLFKEYLAYFGIWY